MSLVASLGQYSCQVDMATRFESLLLYLRPVYNLRNRIFNRNTYNYAYNLYSVELSVIGSFEC